MDQGSRVDGAHRRQLTERAIVTVATDIGHKRCYAGFTVSVDDMTPGR